MDLKQLRYLQAVAEQGSFSKAAMILSVAQPVLSRQIKALEEEMSVALFYRNGRGAKLTGAGAVLAEHASQILAMATQAAAEVRALRDVPGGSISVGLPPTVGPYIAAPLLRQFTAKFPAVSLSTMEGFSGILLEWLCTGRIDIAVLYNAPQTSSLLVEPVLEEELFLFGAISDPENIAGPFVSGERLKSIPLIVPGHRHGLIDAGFADLGGDLKVSIEVESLNSILALVEDGAGYTILPYRCCSSLVEAGRLRFWPIMQPRLIRKLGVATSSQSVMTNVMRATTKILRDQIRLNYEQMSL
jgi:LysR family transcriptional regulator, nitrogen assimilation regulatory protein